MTWLRSTVVASLVVAATSAAAGRPHIPLIELPLLVEANVCALPATTCPKPDEAIRLVVDGGERQVGFRDLIVLQGTVTAGQVFSALRPRPVRLFGPAEELAKLEPGVPLRMRAVLRLGAGYLFLESLTPIEQKK
jgi:hypothetical protein